MKNYDRANPPEKLTISVNLKNEEVRAFLDYVEWSRAGSIGLAGRELLVRGLMERRILPEWWLRRNRGTIN